MSRARKIGLIAIGSIAGLVVVLFISGIIIVQTDWFHNYVRAKLVSSIEDATGGRAEIGAFGFDWRHLRATVRNLVVHGLEGTDAAPLFRADLVQLDLSLISPLRGFVDLRYLLIDRPQAHVIVYPDGHTNVPGPKTPSKPGRPPLQSVINLSIDRFDVRDGSVAVNDRSTPLDATGRNLRATFDYDAARPAYTGELRIDPLDITYEHNPVVPVALDLPLTLEANRIALHNGTLRTPDSQIGVDGNLHNLATAVKGAFAVNATISVRELNRALGLGLTPNPSSPDKISADLALTIANGGVQARKGQIQFGNSRIDVSGAAANGQQAASAQFDANLHLDEVGRILGLSSHPAGDLHTSGAVTFGPNGGYRVDAKVDADHVSVDTGGKRLSGIAVSADVTATPDRIAVSGLHANAAGGTVTGSGSVSGGHLEFAGNVRDFSLAELTSLLGKANSGYSGVVSGPVRVQGDMKRPSTISASADLRVAPKPGQIPVSGRLNLDYNGQSGAVNVAHSYLKLPNTRVDISGSLGKQIELHAVSSDLRDLRPLAPSLPVELKRNGAATVDATVRGSLTNPKITGHVNLHDFSYGGRPFSSLSADIAASPSKAAVTNGRLTRGSLQTEFAATVPLRNWKPAGGEPAIADLNMRDADVQDLLAIIGKPDLPVTGSVTAQAHLTGSLDDPRGSIELSVVDGTIEGEPFDKLSARAVFTASQVSVPTLELTAGPSRLSATATYHHPVANLAHGTIDAHIGSNDVQLARFQQLVKDRPGLQGRLNLDVDLAAAVQPAGATDRFRLTAVNGNLAVRGLQLEGKSLGDLNANLATAGSSLRYAVRSDLAGSVIRVDGESLLTGNHETTASASIGHLPIGPLLALAGEKSLPIAGTLSADVSISGSLSDPRATSSVTVVNGTAYQEHFDRLDASLSYSNTLIDARSIVVDAGPAHVRLSGSFSHPAGQFTSGNVQFRAETNRVDLSRLHLARFTGRRLGGAFSLSANGAFRLSAGHLPVFTSLDGEIEARDIAVDGRHLGRFDLTAANAGRRISFDLTAEAAGASLHGSGTVLPESDYDATVRMEFSNLTYSALRPWIGTAGPDTLDARASGRLDVSGPLARPAGLNGALTVNDAELFAASVQGANQPRVPVRLQNTGPMVVRLADSVLSLENVRLRGRYSHLSLTGSAGLDAPHRLDLRVEGNVDLRLLEALDPNVFSKGGVLLNASVSGTSANPLVSGTLRLSDADFNMINLPVGLTRGNGVIRFSGAEAVVQNLTGELGGGKLNVSGFVRYGGPAMAFRVEASVDRARVQYPENMSTEASAQVSLAGNSDASLLSGDVTIRDIAFFSHSDIGSMLTSAATPAPAPTSRSGLIGGMRFDVRIRTAPDTQLRTTLTENVQLTADLRLRGSVDSPGMLGRLQVTEGDITFFGAKYGIDQGVVSFFDPNRIAPVLNIDLETKVQGIQISLRVAGPMERLKLTYRSDPPLQFSEIVSLLATGRANITDPVFAARQPAAPQQSFEQMGASALLGQTVANPVAGRLQRLFGVSKLKIDPKLISGSTTPQATVTLQQQITPDLTFTYIQDVTQTNPETVRIEWSINPEWSAIAQRDYNGSVDIDLFYKRRFW